MSGKILAIDIGGTKIAYALVDFEGNLLTERQRIETPKSSAAEVFTVLKNIIQTYEANIEAVGIATAGEVDRDNRRIIGSVGNMPRGYGDTDFQALTAKPVFVENDANAVMWAEYKAGAAQGCPNAMVVAVGTGLGLGILVDGKLLRGKSGRGGEGHFGVARGRKRRCSCGNWDCYEVYASGTALSLTAREIYGDELKNSFDVIKGLEQGDAQAKEVFEIWQGDILDGIVGLANLFDPEVVLLFGGLTDYLNCQQMEEQANRRVVAAPFKLCKAQFEHNAALIGAGLIAAEKLKD